MKLTFNEKTIPAMIAGASAGAFLSGAIPNNSMMVTALCSIFVGAVNGLIQSSSRSNQVSETAPSP